MPKARKTVEIAFIKEKANHFFRVTANDMRNERRSLQSFVETLLFKAEAYKGFRFLEERDVEPGKSVGIIFDNSPEHKHVYPDDSRISFY